MKAGAPVLVIGIIAFCLGLTINSIYGLLESELISSTIWILLWGGVLFWIVGVIMLIQQPQECTKRTVSVQKPINPRLVKFFISLIGALFFGSISILFFGFLLNNDDPRFYTMAFGGLFFATVLFAFSTSSKG